MENLHIGDGNCNPNCSRDSTMPLGRTEQSGTCPPGKDPAKPGPTTMVNEVSATLPPAKSAYPIPCRVKVNGNASIDQIQEPKTVFSSQPTYSPLESDDWTRSLPETDHVRFFRSTNWAATALGPIKDWGIALRLHTHTLFADSRSACIYWYVFHVGDTLITNCSRGEEKTALYNQYFALLSVSASICRNLSGCSHS